MIKRFTTAIILIFSAIALCVAPSVAQDLDAIFSVPDTFETEEKKLVWMNYQAMDLRNSAPESSLVVLDSTLIWSRELGLQKVEGQTLNMFGVMHKIFGNYQKALEYYSQALAIFQALNDTRNISACYNNIGVVYEEQTDFDEALVWYKKSYDIDVESGDEGNKSVSLYNIGAIFELKGDVDSALDYYAQSLAIEERLDNKEGIYYAYSGLCSANNKLGNYADAMSYIKKSLTLARELENPNWIAHSHQEMGAIHLAEGRFEDAVEHWEEALALAKEIKYRNLIQALYKQLSQAYDSAGNYKASLEAYKLHVAVDDSIRNMATDEKVAKFKAQFNVEQKEHENELLRQKNESDAEAFTLIIVGVAIFAALVLLLAIFIFRGYRNKRLANEQLSEQSARISEQKDALERIHEHITDSIEYAKRIQDAILPPSTQIAGHFPEHMVFYRPKDIVSGDFYWMTERQGQVLFAVADCTGHGVPGAFMSIVGHSLLEKAVKQLGITNPSEILGAVSRDLYKTLRKRSNTDVKDGMDIGIWSLDTKTNVLTFAGAHHPMYLIRGGELQQFKGDKAFLGRNAEQDKPVQSHQIQLQAGDTIYMFSDGFADQKGGPKGKKFYYPPFRDLLVELQDFPMAEHEQMLYNKMKLWRGDREQIDDMLIVGLRIKGTVEPPKFKKFGVLKTEQEALYNGNLINSYWGQFDAEIVNKLLKECKQRLEQVDLHPKLRKKGYNVIVECVENINKHGADSKEGGFVLAGDGEQITVSIANLVLANEVETLEANIAEVNGADREQLKELYRNQIGNGAISDRGGAGLGLIDIALKSGSKLEYKFYPQEGDTSIFTLKVEINI